MFRTGALTAVGGSSAICLAALIFLLMPAATHAATFLAFDENGNEMLDGTSFPGVGFLAPDPTPGGLSSALEYSISLGFPITETGGDVLLTDSHGNSDLIRFIGGTGPTLTLFFYSADTTGGSLADTGLPTTFQSNTLSTPEGNSSFPTPGSTLYPPLNPVLLGQPGFFSLDTNYFFVSPEGASRPVPEPVTPRQRSRWTRGYRMETPRRSAFTVGHSSEPQRVSKITRIRR